MKTVIFACVHNAGRSQMAAAWFNALAAAPNVRAKSAGTDPSERVHPEVVHVRREVGIDLSHTSRRSSATSWRAAPTCSSRWVVRRAVSRGARAAARRLANRGSERQAAAARA